MIDPPQDPRHPRLGAFYVLAFTRRERNRWPDEPEEQDEDPHAENRSRRLHD